MNRWEIIPGVNLYFITATIMERQNVFVSIPFYNDVIRNLQYCCTEKGLHLHGYVVMPDHAHFIVSTESLERLSDTVRYFKRLTSQDILALLEEMNRYEVLELFHRAELHQECRTRQNVWQDGFQPIAIETGKIFQQTLDSLHENPVRKGFVDRPEYWCWSSARNYILNDHALIQIECLDKEELHVNKYGVRLMSDGLKDYSCHL